MKYLSSITFLLSLLSLPLLADLTSYKGFIGEQPITMVISGNRAIYAYDKYDTPIELYKDRAQSIDSNLVFIERDSANVPLAYISLFHFSSEKDSIIGTWSKVGGETPFVTVSLVKEFTEPRGKGSVLAEPFEMIANKSLENHYFKLVIEKDSSEEYAFIERIKIHQKGSDKLFQTFVLQEPMEWRQGLIAIDDYNFDGREDFSIFHYCSGTANCWSDYYLRDSISTLFAPPFGAMNLALYPSDKTFTTSYHCAGQGEKALFNNKHQIQEEIRWDFNGLIEEIKKTYSWHNDRLIDSVIKIVKFNESFDEEDYGGTWLTYRFTAPNGKRILMHRSPRKGTEYLCISSDGTIDFRHVGPFKYKKRGNISTISFGNKTAQYTLYQDETNYIAGRINKYTDSSGIIIKANGKTYNWKATEENFGCSSGQDLTEDLIMGTP